jgi:hypothetical protein
MVLSEQVKGGVVERHILEGLALFLKLLFHPELSLVGESIFLLTAVRLAGDCHFDERFSQYRVEMHSRNDLRSRKSRASCS